MALEGESFRTATAVVPVFNGAGTLQRCLSSLRLQNATLKEVLVIEDGSRDGSAEIARSFVREDPRFVIVQHAVNQGLARTLNEGIGRATGDAILILHQDCELVREDWVERGLELLGDHPRISVCGFPEYAFDELTSTEIAFGTIRDTFFTPDVAVDRLGFSEFKCDLMPGRLARAIRFDVKFRISGEDQVLSAELSESGAAILRFRQLRYVQRFGNGSSFLHQLRKEMTYAITEAGVLLRTSFRIARLSLESRSSSRRLLNRASSSLSAIGLVSCLLLLAAGANWLILVLPLFLVAARVESTAMRWLALRRTVRLRVQSLALSLALVPLTDVVYMIGFLAGFVRYATADVM